MSEFDTITAVSPEPSDRSASTGRRDWVQRLGTGAIGAAAVASVAGAGLALSSTSASAAAITDTDILNFALNFEYLGSEYYLRAISGSGLAASLLTGTGTQGTVIGGTMVPFNGSAIESYAQRLAIDEIGHVEFIRAVVGSAAISEPTIDLDGSWTTLAIAAGLIAPGQTFNPFADPVSFLLGAYVIEDVCVTALTGAVALLTDPNNITGAAGLLGTEGYQAGMIRSLLSDLGAGAATDAISNLRATLSGMPDDIGTSIPGNDYNIVPNDINGLVFRRTPAQVLNIAYGGSPTGGGFFPNRVNGNIR